MKKNIFYLLIILYTLPLSLDYVLPSLYDILIIFKILLIPVFLLMILRKKISISSFSLNVLIYVIYLFFITFVNDVNLSLIIKVYGLNIGTLLLLEIIFHSQYKNEFIKFFSNYLFILIIINLIFLIFNPTGNYNNLIYFLGYDNRFILYMIPQILGYYYLWKKDNNLKYKKRFYLSYFISLITLLMTWSVSAFLTFLFIGIFINHNKIAIFFKSKLIIGMIVIITILIAFFKIQNYFSYFIVNILHKSLTLSYRTIIWDKAIKLATASPFKLIFGSGYFDSSFMFMNIAENINHFHNIFINTLVFSGIIGIIIYFNILLKVMKSIRLNKNLCSNFLTIIFLGILILMLFDTFELYPLYYITLFLIYNFAKEKMEVYK